MITISIFFSRRNLRSAVAIGSAVEAGKSEGPEDVAFLEPEALGTANAANRLIDRRWSTFPGQDSYALHVGTANVSRKGLPLAKLIAMSKAIDVLSVLGLPPITAG